MDATTFPYTNVALTIFLGGLFWLKLESFLFESFSFYCHCFSIGRVPMSIGLHKIRWTKNDPGKRPNRKYIGSALFRLDLTCELSLDVIAPLTPCTICSFAWRPPEPINVIEIVWYEILFDQNLASIISLLSRLDIIWLFRKTNKQTWKEITNVLFRSLHLFFSVRIDGGLQGLGIFLMVSTQIEAFLSFWKSKRGKKIRNIKAHRFPS